MEESKNANVFNKLIIEINFAMLIVVGRDLLIIEHYRGVKFFFILFLKLYTRCRFS